MKLSDNQNENKTLEIEICENGQLTFSIYNKEEHNFVDTVTANEEDAKKFFSEISKIKEMVK